MRGPINLSAQAFCYRVHDIALSINSALLKIYNVYMYEYKIKKLRKVASYFIKKPSELFHRFLLVWVFAGYRHILNGILQKFGHLNLHLKLLLLPGFLHTMKRRNEGREKERWKQAEKEGRNVGS